MAKKHDLSDKDYTKLGKSVEKIIQKDYVDLAMHWPRLIRVSLLRGLFVGFGGVLGATVVVAILIWLLSLADSVPLLGRVFENLRNTIKQ